MAQQKRSNNRSGSSGSRSGQRSSQRSNQPVMTVLIITVVVLLDLLISWNNFDRFFLILGIELVVVAVIWIIGLVMSIGNEAQNSDTDGE